MPGFDAAVGEGTQHFKLIVVADLLDMAERFAAKLQRLAVQFQHIGA